ncbi:immunoglobulin superfamily member 1-like [Mauremys reevesii]|uniref:immunoglobulin superfamily member 1-like n=1 Tax=Mauremys reevesii TaxID=260615 RepID=UPI00193F98C7|nr:immunoglobulin superfamily member 1-like [Mauremys reevesii]
MASALTVLLLGCWLAGHSGVWGQPSYPKPSISGIPSEGVSLEKSVSIWCKGQHQAVQFMLYKDGRHVQSVDSDSQALFLINIVSREQGGNYNCSYHSRSEPFKMSDSSDPVELVVRDPNLPRPNISLSPTGVTTPGADVTIRCQGQRRDVRFFLHKAGDLNPQQHMDPAGAGAEFRIPSVGRQHGGNYSCSYRNWSEPFVSSQPSDTVQLVVAGETNPSQPGEAPAPTRPGVMGPGGTNPSQPGEAPAPTHPGVTGPGKGAAPRPSSTSPMGALKAPAQQDSTYTSIDEGKQPQTLPQEPDPDGLTYAELNHQPLQAKRGGPAPAPQPAQPGVYAAINVSRGAPQ